MQFKGKIIHIGDIEKVWQNSLDKRTVVLEEVSDKDYKWWIAFDLIKDKVFLIDGFEIWNIVEVSLNFKASEYNGKYYTNINWRKIEGKVLQKDDRDELPFN